MEGIIYQIRNKINNKCYIGQSINNNLARAKQHFYDASTKQHPLSHSINKYGKDNFEIVVLEKVQATSKIGLINKLNELERLFIKKYNSLHKNGNGYNLRDGGNGGGNGVTAWNKGKPWSEEVLKKIREAKAKQDKICPPHTGIFHTDEQKKKISENTKKAMKNMTEEQWIRLGKRVDITIEKIIDILRVNNNNIYIKDIATQFNVGRLTIRRRIKEAGFKDFNDLKSSIKLN